MYTDARGLKPYLQINSCWPLNLLTVHLFIVGKNIFRIAAKKKKKKRLPQYFVSSLPNTISSRQVMRIKKKISIRGLLVDPVPNSVN